MAGYVFETVGIATYTVQIAAAQAAGDVKTQAAREQILPQEVDMAEWLLEHLSEITEPLLIRSEDSNLEAKNELTAQPSRMRTRLEFIELSAWYRRSRLPAIKEPSASTPLTTYARAIAHSGVRT